MNLVKLPTIDRTASKPLWLDQSLATDYNSLLTSEHQANFVQHCYNPTIDYKPKVSAYVSSALPTMTNLQSEHRINYVTHSSPPVHFRTRKGQIQIPREIPMENSSVYRDEFAAKSAEKRPNYKPPHKWSNYGVEDPLNSLYRTDYRNWKPANTFFKLDSSRSLQSAPVLSESPSKVRSNLATKECPQTETSDYRANFTKFSGIPRDWGVQPVYRPPKKSFHTDTTYNNTFVSHPVRITQQFKPGECGLALKGPFQKRSLYQEDFTARPIPLENKQTTNIYQNQSSITYQCGNKADLEPSASVPFHDYSDHVFYHT